MVPSELECAANSAVQVRAVRDEPLVETAIRSLVARLTGLTTRIPPSNGMVPDGQ
jgi:hypothetical protein